MQVKFIDLSINKKLFIISNAVKELYCIYKKQCNSDS